MNMYVHVSSEVKRGAWIAPPELVTGSCELCDMVLRIEFQSVQHALLMLSHLSSPFLLLFSLLVLLSPKPPKVA